MGLQFGTSVKVFQAFIHNTHRVLFSGYQYDFSINLHSKISLRRHGKVAEKGQMGKARGSKDGLVFTEARWKTGMCSSPYELGHSGRLDV